MKKANFFNKLCKGIPLYTLLFCFLLVSTVGIASSKEYTANEVSQLESDIEEGLYDEYILSESGGVYDIKDIDIATSAVVKSKDGLKEKPTMIFTGENTSAYNVFFDLGAEDLNITLQGIIFDGTSAPENMMGISRIDQANCSIQIIDCEIKNFLTNTGFIRIESTGAALTIEDTFVHDCYGRLIRIGNEGNAIGDLIILNSTFANITNEPVIHWLSAVKSSLSSITIDQCTFYNIANNACKFGTVTNGVSISNSNFDAITKSIENAMSSPVTITSSYCGFGATLAETITVNDSITTAPLYSNPSILDLKLLNENDILGSDETTPIGDSRWTTAANENLLEVLYSVQILTDEEGQEAFVKSSYSSGSVYIILDGEAQATVEELDAAVAANKGVKGSVTTAYESVGLSVAGITTGTYYAYAVSNSGMISAKGTNAISVYTSLNVQNDEQSVPNNSSSIVEVISSKNGHVYIAIEGDYTSVDALDAAVLGLRAAKAECIAEELAQISANGIRPGTYYAYAVDSLQNISTRSTNPIYITSSIFVEYEAQTASNEEGAWAVAYVRAGTADAVAYLLNDELSADTTVTTELLESAIASSNASSLHIETENTNYKVPTAGLTPGNYHFYLVKDGEISEQGNATITVRQPKTYYFAEDEVEDMRLALYNREITTGDEVVLTTSGGHYGFKTYFRIYGGITFRADEGLAERPVLTYDPDAHGEIHRSYMRLMEFYPPAGMLYIKGIEFDGGAADESINNDGTCIFEARYNATFNYPYSIVYEDCHIHDFNTVNTNSSGASSNDGYIFRQRANAYADSIVFNNCIFHDTYKAPFQFISGTNYKYFGKFEINNCTFYNTNGLMAITDPNMSESTIEFSHCTIDQIGEDNMNSRLVTPDALDGININNSIITNSCSTTEADSALVIGSLSTISNTAFFNVPQVVGGVQTEIASDKDPNYYSDQNYAIRNADLLSMSSTQSQIGDLRWLATDDLQVEPILIMGDSVSLYLSFNQPVDTLSAVINSNYLFSGTFGVTGAPSQVELVDANIVKLSLEDMSGGADFETIVVTASEIVNVNGNSLQSNYDKAIYTFPILANMPAQTVGNEDGQFILSTCGSDNGSVYAILEEVSSGIFEKSQLDDLVESGYGATAQVTTAGEYAQISAGGLTPGIYYGYAVNAEGNIISSRSIEAATVLGLEATLNLQFGINNGAGQTVTVQSSYQYAQVYLVADDSSLVVIQSKEDLLKAVDDSYAAVAEVSGAFEDVKVNVEGVYATTSGVRYRAYVLAGDSISEASSGAVIITADATSSSDLLQKNVKVYANNGMLSVVLNTETKIRLEVLNMNGQRMYSHTILENTTLPINRGMYIVQVISQSGCFSTKIVN